MGWGLDAARRFFSAAAAAVVAAVARPPEGPVGTGWIQGERSELRYVLASYWMLTLRVSSDDYSKLRLL